MVTNQNDLMLVSAATNVAASMTNLQHKLHAVSEVTRCQIDPKKKSTNGIVHLIDKPRNSPRRTNIISPESLQDPESHGNPKRSHPNLGIQSQLHHPNLPGLAHTLQKGMWFSQHTFQLDDFRSASSKWKCGTSSLGPRIADESRQSDVAQ
jgi:hypothetical protein